MKYQDDQFYHVFNRGAHKAKIFFSPENYRYCLRLMKKYSRQYRVSLAAYCLMPNHYHLVVKQQPLGSISKFLQGTFTAYVQALNLQRAHSGTLFQGKAKSKLIDSDSYALQIVRYLHLNPVEAGIVPEPQDWQFSDFAVWVGAGSNGLTDLSLRNSHFRNGEEYREFVEGYKSEKVKEKISEFVFDGE